MVVFINDKFPNLQGSTQDTDSFDLYDYFGDSWGILFMHPGDFTPVCTTELGEAANLAPEFAQRGVKICGFSCSPKEAHRYWIRDIRYATGAEVKFPIFCDPTREHAAKLGMLDSTNLDHSGLPLTVRAVYVLKPCKTVALMMTYPATSGRNFDEILRAIDTLQMTYVHKVVTPVNWKPGNDVIVCDSLTDAMADETFGKDGYRMVEMPSEKEKKDLKTHYFRYTSDPTVSGGDS